MELKHSDTIGRRDLSQLSDEDLLNIIGSVGAELANPDTLLVDDGSSAEIQVNPSLLRFRFVLSRGQKQHPDVRWIAEAIKRGALQPTASRPHPAAVGSR